MMGSRRTELARELARIALWGGGGKRVGRGWMEMGRGSGVGVIASYRDRLCC